MRFQVLVNGSPVCTTGQPGFGVMTALLSWRKLDPTKLPPEQRATLSSAGSGGELEFSVGGIDSTDNRHTSWKVPPIAVGDEITIRVLPSGQFDAPTVKFG